MGRKPRIEYYGAIYHMTHMGKSDIFKEEEDKLTLLGILGDMKEVFDFKLIAYCILDNQYNLLIKAYNIPISKIMHGINMNYARSYNSRYKKIGSPFKGRYKALIVSEGNGLLNTAKEIHCLPVFLKLADTIGEYKWSSDVFYRLNLESIVDIDYILNVLSIERNIGLEKYKELMSSSEKLEDNKAKLDLDDILHDICTNNVDFDLIKSGSKKSYLMKYKLEYIKASKQLGFTCLEIGENIGITERAVRKHLHLSK